MIRCLVIDDEELARQHMTRLLLPHSDLEVVAEAANGIEAFELISDLHPDLVFLDIEMPMLNAFDMLAQLSHLPLIVFTTAYDQYAISAFDANAIDYLLKPIQAVRLSQAVEKARARLDKPRREYDSALRRAASTALPGPPAKLAARRGKRIILLSPGEVLYITMEDQIAFLHTQNDRFVTDRTMAELEELLQPAGFFRISRSAIVNLNHARELLPWSSGAWRVKLSNAAELDVSRERARQLKVRIG